MVWNVHTRNISREKYPEGILLDLYKDATFRATVKYSQLNTAAVTTISFGNVQLRRTSYSSMKGVGVNWRVYIYKGGMNAEVTDYEDSSALVSDYVYLMTYARDE